MSPAKFQHIKFFFERIWNRTLGNYFKRDIYGVMLFGVRFTPAETAEKLGGFSAQQRLDFNIIKFGNTFIITRK